MTTINLGLINLNIMSQNHPYLGTKMGTNEELKGNRYFALVSGPDEIQLEVAYTIWEDGDGQIETVDAGNSPLPYSRLGHGGRIGILKLNQKEKFMEIRIAKVNEDLWSTFVQTNEEELNDILGENVSDLLNKFGAIEFGKRSFLLSDISNRRNHLGVTFKAENITIPFVIYTLSRPLAMLRRNKF